jgi:ribosomal protein L6P/L9E
MISLFIPSFFTVECTKTKVMIRYMSFFKEFEFPNVFFFFCNSVLFINSTNTYSFFAKKLISNYLLDVLSKINVKIEIVGFNYRAVLSPDSSSLLFFVGYTNLMKINIPSEISISFLDKKNKIFKLEGIDRLHLIPFSIKIRNIKRPNIYTGHGIRFYKEKLTLKEVKK